MHEALHDDMLCCLPAAIIRRSEEATLVMDMFASPDMFICIANFTMERQALSMVTGHV